MNVVDLALRHAQTLNGSSYVWSLAAGIATSVGPCVAPRYAAVTAIVTSSAAARLQRLSAFVAGAIAVYVAIASIGSVLIRLAQASSLIYWVLALALSASAIHALSHTHKDACASANHNAPTLGAAFLLGAATSTTISPCCTPVLIGLGALSSTAAETASTAGLVGAFTIGHMAPLIVLFVTARAAKNFMSAHREAAVTVSAGVTLALGAYYAVLA